MGAGKPKVKPKVLATSVPGANAFPGLQMAIFSIYLHMVESRERGREDLSCASFYKIACESSTLMT